MMHASVKMQNVYREFVVKQVSQAVRSSELVAIAHTGHLKMAQRSTVIRTMEGVGGHAIFGKNTLLGKGLKKEGAAGLVPLLRGKTALVVGPAEVPAAKALLTLTKEVPNFFVLGALLNSERLLEACTIPLPLTRRRRPGPAMLSPATAPTV